MKKLLVLVVSILAAAVSAAQEPVFILKNDVCVGRIQKTFFQKGEKFIFYPDVSGGVNVNRHDPLEILIKLYPLSDSENGFFIPVTDVYLENNPLKISSDVQKDYWIPVYYYDAVKSNDREKDVFTYEPYWEHCPIIQHEDWDWYQWFHAQRYYFGDFYFVVFGYFGFNEVDFFAYLEEVSENKLVYTVQRMYSNGSDYKKKTVSVYVNPSFLPLYEKQTPFRVIFTIDGDYMNMYTDDISEENLFQTLIRTTPEACTQIENWIRVDSNDLSKVSWPRHADGSCEYENMEQALQQIAVKGIYRVSENLRLREEEDTSSAIITTMRVGTRVKVLAAGKEETIDGITASWVQVEVQKEARDKDGNTIPAGTTGWCFGGYLW